MTGFAVPERVPGVSGVASISRVHHVPGVSAQARAASSADAVWDVLGASMRQLRTNANVSLRAVEASTGWGRGVLSQMETAKARPRREIVEWYDARFGGDGLLVSLFAEARGAHGVMSAARTPAELAIRNDHLRVEWASLPYGERVAPAGTLTVQWRLRNCGLVAWRDRSLRRVGAVAADHLLSSPASVPLPDAQPGAAVVARVPIGVPAVAGTFAAYWEVTDRRGRRCFGRDELLAVTVVADW